jgi:heme/copper-type cytochrome/quinol oxidase subunit 3
VATVFLIGGEIMFFAGLIFAFWVLRLAAPFWPPPLQPRLPVAVTGVNTLVLLASSAAMFGAGRALERGARQALVGWLGASATLGVTFLAVQGYEWAQLLRFGLTASDGVYGATFYTLIGTHAAHVVAALVWLGAAVALAARGRFTRRYAVSLRACALYWHFVVGLWPILYVSVYLL